MLELGINGFKHFLGAQCAAPDIGVNVVGLGVPQFLEHASDRFLGQLIAFVGEYFLQDLAAQADMLAALRVTQETADFRARPSSTPQTAPTRATAFAPWW